jgi:ABC-type branched-subunit amino acid transport system substrate-binding protein
MGRELLKQTGMAGLLLGAGLMLSACGIGSNNTTTFNDNVTIVLNTPSAKLPYVAQFTQQGARLAADEVNKAGGIKVGGKTYGIKLESLDNDLSPSKSLDNIKKAVSDKAIAVIDDGYTVDATYQAALAAGLPILVDYDTNAQLIDPDKRPNVYRIAPADDAMAEHLAAYLADKGLKLALVHDDSEYGKDGDKQLTEKFRAKNLAFSPDIELPTSGTDFSAQALQVKQSGATGVLLWARAPVIAAFLKAYRQAGGTARIYSGPNAEDPIVRTQNADHPEYVNGLTYASFRVTTEAGPEAWDKFRKKYEDARLNNGEVDFKVGVQASDKKDVVQPPDWQMFPYDMVYLLKAALEKAGTVDTSGNKLIDALNSVQIKSANGDNRGWKRDTHEGVVDDDVYFAVFQDMVFKPVQDDALSKSLPPIDQK